MVTSVRRSVISVLIALLSFLLSTSEACLSQSDTGKMLNDQGCEALTDHDYVRAEKLFLASYAAAAKNNDTKRLIAALANLQAEYTTLGRDREAADCERRIERLKHPLAQNTASAMTTDVGVTKVRISPASVVNTSAGKTLNDQGCEALTNHNYVKAEKLFLASYVEAAKTKDTRRLIVALANLQTEYLALGRDHEAADCETRIEHLKHPQTSFSGGNLSSYVSVQSHIFPTTNWSHPFGSGISSSAASISLPGSIPSYAQTPGPDQLVNGYSRQNGTYVDSYHRTVADDNPYNNYSTRGNVNPYTDAPGTVNPNSGGSHAGYAPFADGHSWYK